MSLESFLTGFLWPEKQCRFSGIQFAVSDHQSNYHSWFAGKTDAIQGANEVEPETLFDLASLTKLYTATLASILHAEGEIDLDSPIGSWSEVSDSLGSITSRELLTHTSGLPPWWEEQITRDETINELFSLEPGQSQRGSVVYSCTGYSMFSILIERKYSVGFDTILKQKILSPLELEKTQFNPNTKSIARAEEGNPIGIVHDPRAKAMNGVSGNAGLFANADDVHKFLKALISDGKVITDSAREQLFTPTVQSEWGQAIGFRFNDHQRVGDSTGFFSHTGFTGTLAMLNPETGTVGVMLSNRLVCNTTREQMAGVYQGFAERVSRGRVD